MGLYAICGDSACGKTTLAKELTTIIPKSMILECDRYHKWERNDPSLNIITNLNPEANNLDIMKHDILTLVSGRSIYQVDYLHKNGKFSQKNEIHPAENIIVCGLHLVDVSYDLKIYINVSTELKEMWKIERDIRDRGYTREQVINSINNRRSDFEKFIEPQQYACEVIVNFLNDGVSIDIDNKIDMTQYFTVCHYNRVDFSIRMADTRNSIIFTTKSIHSQYMYILSVINHIIGPLCLKKIKTKN